MFLTLRDAFFFELFVWVLKATKNFLILLAFVLVGRDAEAQSLVQLQYFPHTKLNDRLNFSEYYENRIFIGTDSIFAIYDYKGTMISDRYFRSITFYRKPKVINASVFENGKQVYVLLDVSGKQINELKFDNISSFTYNTAICKQGFRYYILDSLGKLNALPGEYQELIHLNPGIYRMKSKEGNYGLVDHAGKVLLPPIYSAVEYSPEPSLYYVYLREKKGQKALVNIKNELVIPFGLYQIAVSGKYIEVKKPAENGSPSLTEYFNFQGQKLKDIPASPEITSAYIYQKTYSNGKLYGLQHPVTKKPVTELRFTALKPVKFGLFEYYRQNYELLMGGYIRANGQVVVERLGFTGVQLTPFDILNYKEANNSGRWYDETGKELLPDYFKAIAGNCIYNFPKDKDTTKIEVLGVSLGGHKLGLYDRNKTAITKEIYDTLAYITKDLLYFKNKERRGLVTAQGVEFDTGYFETIYPVSKNKESLLYFTFKNRVGLMTREGKVIYNATYASHHFSLISHKYLWVNKTDGIYVYELIW